MTKNRDRKGREENSPDHEGRPVAIDNGYSFGHKGQPSADGKSISLRDTIDEAALEYRKAKKTNKTGKTQFSESEISELKNATRARLTEILPERRVYDNLVRIDESQWRAKLQDQLSPNEIDEFLKGRKRVIGAVDDARKEFGDDIFKNSTPEPSRAKAKSQAPSKGDELEELENHFRTNPWSSQAIRQTDGQTVLTIYGLRRSDHMKFGQLVDKAIRAGKIDRIDAGDVVGVKVLPLIVRIKEIAPPGKKLTVKGTVTPGDLIRDMRWQKAQYNGAANKKSVSTQHSWPDSELKKFEKSFDELDIRKACRDLWGVDLENCGGIRFEIDNMGQTRFERGNPLRERDWDD